MFAHETSEMCKFDNICCNKLCPFQHTINQQENQNSDDNEEKDIAGEKELNLTDEYDDDEMEMEPKYFQTSTPKKREIECEDCSNKSECMYCQACERGTWWCVHCTAHTYTWWY